MKTFGEVLSELREKAELSQDELAEKAGTSQKAISFWERNMREPSLSNIQKLCDALGVDCSVFFAKSESTSNESKKKKK